jgi:DNA-binding response OmpR family regulator
MAKYCARLDATKQASEHENRPAAKKKIEGNRPMASILIADDDPNILRALAFLMHAEGHEVRTVADGDAALAAVAEKPPELLLLDVMMPRRNGYDVCRTLRENPRYERLRIIMLTAKGRDADRQAGLALGVDAYLIKPFAIRDVVGCVNGVLASAQQPHGPH